MNEPCEWYLVDCLSKAEWILHTAEITKSGNEARTDWWRD